MQASDVEPGIYVRPVRNSKTFRQGLYEVEECNTAKVVLRDCMVPVDDCRGEYGTLEASVMQLVQSFVLVKPRIDLSDLDELLAA